MSFASVEVRVDLPGGLVELTARTDRRVEARSEEHVVLLERHQAESIAVTEPAQARSVPRDIRSR